MQGAELFFEGWFRVRRECVGPAMAKLRRLSSALVVNESSQSLSQISPSLIWKDSRNKENE